MQDIIIRKATANDILILTEIGRKTFFETYADHNSEADMQAYLKENFNDQKISKQFSNPNSEFFIAFENNKSIGYLKLNTNDAQTDLKEPNFIEIERIYVLAAYHGGKVGQLLYQKSVETAKEKHKTSIWLGVWEQNPRAIRFYEKNGFVSFAKHIFQVGSEEQTDHLMRKTL